MRTFTKTMWNGKVSEFDDENPPPGLSRKTSATDDMSWYWEKVIMTLEIGQVTKGDFWDIERTS